ncbi:sigma-70 family RNA polymerase sigma factor [Tissierella praeacuta]|uniref:RNA polymerase sigma factor n=1 Tax=Tissierella praeacuta TaxID=43131 RepID=UPI003340C748
MWDELIKLAKEGNKESIKEIIDRLQPLIISSIRKYYNIANEYKDLIQEGNLMILESLNNYNPDKGVHFLGYIKLNLKYLYLNKHKRKIHLSLNETIGDGEQEIIDTLISDNKQALDIILENEMNFKLKKALEKLTERQREIVILYYVKNLSMEEISTNLGISYRTVVNTKAKALDNLRKLMK